VLDILLTGPHDFHGAVDVFGDLDRAGGTVGLEPAAKPAADQMIVDHDLVHRQAGGFCCRGLDARNGLRADPDFAGVVADVGRAVHRLDGRVREEWNLVGRLDLGDGARHRRVDIADILGNRAQIERRPFEFAGDLIGVEFCVRSVVHSITSAASPFFAAPI
jgi:hypothetical protein